MCKFLKICSHIAGIFGAAIAIYLLCRVCPTNDVKFDYIGVIIGILALLVTLLVAWNIYSALGIELRIKEALDKQRQHDIEQKTDLDNFKTEIDSKTKTLETSFSTQIDQQIQNSLKSAKNAYVSLFNTTQAQVAAAIKDINYFQQYTYYQTALNALLQCDNFPSDIRINMVLLDLV